MKRKKKPLNPNSHTALSPGHGGAFPNEPRRRRRRLHRRHWRRPATPLPALPPRRAQAPLRRRRRHGPGAPRPESAPHSRCLLLRGPRLPHPPLLSTLRPRPRRPGPACRPLRFPVQGPARGSAAEGWPGVGDGGEGLEAGIDAAGWDEGGAELHPTVVCGRGSR